MSATKQAQKSASGSLKLQIKINAEWVGKDAQTMAQEMFRCELEQISEEQAGVMLRTLGPLMEAKREQVRAARMPVSGLHSHECITCGQPVNCYHDNCRETVSEHRYCHEGYAAGEWVNYHRRLGERY